MSIRGGVSFQIHFPAKDTIPFPVSAPILGALMGRNNKKVQYSIRYDDVTYIALETLFLHIVSC